MVAASLLRDEDGARDLLAGEEILLEDGAAEIGGRDHDAGELVVLDDFLLNQVAPCKDVLRRRAGRHVHAGYEDFDACLTLFRGGLHVARVDEHRDDRHDREPAGDDQIADAVVHGPSW